jgi:hypothetical protein
VHPVACVSQIKTTILVIASFATTSLRECSDVACVTYTHKEVVAKEAIIVVFICPNFKLVGAHGSIVVEAVCYKLEGHGFET